MIKIRYEKINPLDITNGDGIRVTIFCTGCEHYCEDCFNKDLWSFESGKEFNIDTLMFLLEKLSDPLIDGLSILGGEPMHPKNYKTILRIVNEAKLLYPEKTIWLWTGYTFEELSIMYDISELKNIDIIVDGKYMKELRDMKLKYKGSKNQRVIDLKETINKDKIILKK